MHVLVCHGSKRGGTAGIARTIADRLQEQGHTVELHPASEVQDVSGYHAVVVGGALYSGRWHGDARRFVQRHAATLRGRPVWFFSSGALGASAANISRGRPPVQKVQRLMDRVGARGHATFGGRLEPSARGFIASKMARTRAGDWRDPVQIRAWSDELAAELHRQPQELPPTPAAESWPGERVARFSAVGLCLYAGLTAMAGGLALLLRPDGSLVKAPASLLQHTPFADFFWPGALLFAVVGLGNLLAGLLLALRRSRAAEVVAFGAGAALTGFICIEMLLLRTSHWLQLLYLVTGTMTMVQALKLRQRRAEGGQRSHWSASQPTA
jgi:menaquinone-dependent protoporphyrinogen oxidase